MQFNVYVLHIQCPKYWKPSSHEYKSFNYPVLVPMKKRIAVKIAKTRAKHLLTLSDFLKNPSRTTRMTVPRCQRRNCVRWTVWAWLSSSSWYTDLMWWRCMTSRPGIPNFLCTSRYLIVCVVFFSIDLMKGTLIQGRKKGTHWFVYALRVRALKRRSTNEPIGDLLFCLWMRAPSRLLFSRFICLLEVVERPQIPISPWKSLLNPNYPQVHKNQPPGFSWFWWIQYSTV